ncbi:hypothetical protein A4H97_32590 [Niastella yeongjuensis]|uniref:Uncharacterized protein n=1 Tax=Niastella yeongjuensis TaxID=354355 RepID=A0A1V9EGJ6_9BACT|nr:hypothetical protein [Niastella yeongjuensis]OQP45258.1 hypothetical protein A4H97_32590 [Niastella yeongjuensis]SEO28096.1 hypothetical protein SAMN05660816_02480 [Niastella yeongjuensis]
MSEQLYFFKFDKEIARNKLSALINEDDSFSYKQYLSENPESEEKIQFNNVTNKIEENIELLSTEELWSLYSWFSERIEKLNTDIKYDYLDDRALEEMRNYGLDLFYDFPTTTSVRIFYDFLRDYDTLTDHWIEDTCGPDELNGLLNYIICYTGELTLFLNKYYYEWEDGCEENLKIEQLIHDINSTSNSYFHILALLEFENPLEHYNETMQLVPKLTEFRQANKDKSSYSLPTELYEIEKSVGKMLNVASLLHIASYIKEKIKNYNGKITRIHSF